MAKANKKSFFEERKKELILIAIAILVVIGVSFAWLTQTLNSSRTNVIVAGKLELTLDNESPIIKVGGDYGYGFPMSDYDAIVGEQAATYTFRLRNTGTEPASYVLFLDDVDSYTNASNESVSITSGNRIPNDRLRYSLNGSTPQNLSAAGSPRRLIAGTLAAGAQTTYTLKVWINTYAENSDVVGKVFAAKIRVESTQSDYSDPYGATRYFNYY